jgi:hypothetical protein
VSAYVDRLLWLPKQGLNLQSLRSGLSFYLAREETLAVYEETSEHFGVPRAYGGIVARGQYRGQPLEDRRPEAYEPTELRSRIQLDHAVEPGGVLVATGEDLQRQAHAHLVSGRDGGLELYCGAGKTVISLHAIATRNVPALVVVDNEPLLDQWRRQAERLLDMPSKAIGLWQGKASQWDRSLVFTTYQTLSRRAPELSEEQRKRFGMILYDEGHHLSSVGYHAVASAFYGQRINLSATPKRPDGLHILANWHIGPALFSSLKPPLTPRCTLVWTGAKTTETSPSGAPLEKHLAKLSAAASCDAVRVRAVIQKMRHRASLGHRQLFATRSLVALTNFAYAWYGLPLPVPNPSDELAKEERAGRLLDLLQRRSELGVLAGELDRSTFEEMGGRSQVFSILKFCREGFDQPALDTVWVDGPLGDEGLIQQVLGRVLRRYPAKPQTEAFFLIDDNPAHVQLARRLTTTLNKYPEEKGGPLPCQKVKISQL